MGATYKIQPHCILLGIKAKIWHLEQENSRAPYNGNYHTVIYYYVLCAIMYNCLLTIISQLIFKRLEY